MMDKTTAAMFEKAPAADLLSTALVFALYLRTARGRMRPEKAAE